jgi:hypothetical protein
MTPRTQYLRLTKPLEPAIDGTQVYLMSNNLEPGSNEWQFFQVLHAIDYEKGKMRASAVKATMSLISFAVGLKDMVNALVG